MFFDIHTHILPGMDDGAADISKSAAMLKMAAEENENGFLFATPHFIYGAVNSNPEQICMKCGELQNLAFDQGIPINICPGSEIFLCPEVPELLENGSILPLNKSRYVLVELPMMSVPPYADNVFFELQLKGYIPVLAHPERNREIMRNPEILYQYVLRGILAQVNSTSLKGIFGSNVKDAAFLMIKHNLVHFVASDAHSLRGRSTKLNSAYRMVRNEFGDENAGRLFYGNGLAVYNNEGISSPDPIKFAHKKGFVNRLVGPFYKLLTR